MSDYVKIDERHYFDYFSLGLLDSFKSYLRENHSEYENLISFMFKGPYSFDDDKDCATLYFGENPTPEEMYHTRFWNIFKRFLRLEVDCCNYMFVLHFMCHVFQNKHMYDMQKFREVLENITIKNSSVNLADFCANFYIFLERTEGAALNSFRDVEIHSTEELYDPEIIISREAFSPSVYDALPKYIYMHFYGYAEKDEITPEDIDDIAAYASSSEQLPGLLFPLFCYFYKNTKWIDGMYDVLEKYVFEFYQSYDWNLDSNSADVQANIIINYLEWLWAGIHEGEYNQRMELLSNNEKYDKMAFLYDSREEYKKNMISGEGFWTDFGKYRYGGRHRLWLQFANVIEKASHRIQKNARKGIRYTISNITAMTPCILSYIDEYDKAVDFTINHFAEIDIEDRLSEEFRLALSRMIFQTEDLEKATILYGYFVFDGSTHKRIADFRKDMLDIADCIEGTFNAIKAFNRNQKEYADKFFADLDFIMTHEKIGITNTINDVRKNAAEDEIISSSLFQSLFIILKSLKRNGEINLSLLGVPDIDSDDKWSYPITKDMITNGISDMNKKREKHLKRYEKYKSIIRSHELEQICKPVTYLMQDHLNMLVERQLQEALHNISAIKAGFTDSNQDSETEQIKKLDEVISRITKTIMMSQDSSFYRHKIMSNISTFCEKYLDDTADGILDHLPNVQREEVANYLCTSFAVYEHLTSIDRMNNSVDYAAALLPLTKAIEYILNYIFDRMDCFYYESESINGQTVRLKRNTSNKLFRRNNEEYIKSDRLDFGKYLRILIDYDDIVINASREGALSLHGAKKWYTLDSEPDYRFSIWHGNRVIDISKLRRFSEISLIVCQKISNDPEEFVKYEMSFSETDDVYNRMLLYKALDYVRLNYRNPCAHKDPVSRVTADECMELFFQLEWLMWILIYTIIPE